MDGRATTLAEALSARGYRTGGFVANLTYTTREHGLARGFQVYKDFDRSIPSLLRTSSIIEQLMTMTFVRRLTGFYDIAVRKRASGVNEEFLDWQRDAGTRPWFAFLNYFDAHEPYRAQAPWGGRYSEGMPPRRHDMERYWNLEGGIVDWSVLSAEEVAAERAAYEETIGELDHYLNELLEELRRRGAMDRTMIIVTSDHGEQFGEHDWYTHGNSLYWRVLHVPLVISFPGRVPSGERVGAPVSLRDVPATVWSFVAPGEPSPFPGESLLGAEAGAGRMPDVFAEVTADPAMRDDPRPMVDLVSVSGGSWHYVRDRNGKEELFEVRAGEAGDRNVAGEAAWQAVLDSARAALRARRDQGRAPNVP
jgi:arylsulfatase A-like enzyme